MSFAVTPSISNLSNSAYTEQGSAYVLDSNISFSNGTDYASGYLEFSVSPATTSDFLTISTDGSASTTNGVISIVGTTIYAGNGTIATIIGNIDGAYNGQNGENLRINFSNNFINGDFQIGDDGDTPPFTGWTAENVTNVRLDGSYQIANQNTPVDQTWPGNNGSLHDNSAWSSPPTQTTILTDDFQSSPDIAIRMATGYGSITQGYGIIRGPYIYSNGTVTLEAGDQVSFDWKALADGDAYDAYGYIIDVDNGNTLTILDQTGTNSGSETSWATETITIGSGEGGKYRFVFICGSYDLTGGRAVGGKLMIDDVTVTQAVVSGAISDADLTTIAQKFMYNNTSDNPSTSKTLNVSAKNADAQGGNTGSATATITITAVNDAPLSADVNGSGNEGGTITTTLSATDVDNSGENALSLDGNGDYVDMGQVNSMSINDEITVTSRIFHRAGNGHIVNQGGGWGSQGYSLFRYGSKIRIELQNGSQKTIHDTPAPASNEWHHVAFTWDTNSNTIKTYINGVLAGTNSNFNGPIGDPSENLNIGRKQQHGVYFNGLIDDITIWDRALNQSEIQAVMDFGLCDNKSGLLAYYNFNQGSGNTLTDQSGNGYHGTFYGDAQWNILPTDFNFSIVNQPTNRNGDISLGTVSYNSNAYTAVATYTHDGSEATSDSFTYRTNDDNDNSNTSTANITITGINDVPIAAAVNGSGVEGGTITTTLSATDVDNSNPSDFTFTIVSQPTNITGSVSIGSIVYSSGTFTAIATYTHNDSQTTGDSFTYKANDGAADSNTATATITITAINDAPNAAAVNGSGAEGGTITTTLSATDVDNSNPSDFTFTIVSQPTNITGSVSIGSIIYSSGTFTAIVTYTHNDSQTTGDSFTYKANDGTSDSNTATATITITAINDAPASITINGSGSEGGTITNTLTATDVDDSNAAGFNFIITSQPTNITGTINRGSVSYASGTFTEVITFTHNGSETTSDSFTYKANDGDDNSNIATASITITAVNDAPVAVAVNSPSTAEGGTTTYHLTATDSDNSNITTFLFSIVNQPANGSLTISNTPTYASGTFTAVATYIHNGNETTSDSFTFKVNDGTTDSNTASSSISITAVNDAPVAVAANGSGYEDNSNNSGSNELITTTLTATDVDSSDPSSFTFTIISVPSHILDDNSDGSVTTADVTITSPPTYTASSKTFTATATYKHDGSSFPTTDSFTYQANDGTDGSDTATANIAITAVNDVPVAATVNGSGNEGGTVSVILSATDEDDIDPSLFSFVVVSAPANIKDNNSDGSANAADVSITSPPTYTLSSKTFTATATYKHDGSELTTDSFTYKAIDGGSPSYESNIATAIITTTSVNDAPVTAAVNGSGSEGGTITTTLTATDIDSNDPSTFTFITVSPPTNITSSVNIGDVVQAGNGTFTAVATYTHDSSEYTSDSFTYKANDGDDNSNIATASITITAVNDAPVAAAIPAAKNGNGSEGGIITTTLTATDIDSSEPASFTFTIIASPTNISGAVAIATPTYTASSKTFSAIATYTHNGSEMTSDSFTYKTNDGTDDSNTATATIAITAVNDAPVAMAVNSNGNEGDTITTTLTAIDTDSSDPATFTFSIITQPTNKIDSVSIGDVSYDSGTFSAVAIYTHDDSQTTSDSLTYNANDGEEDSNTATATISITAINDAPLLESIDSLMTNEDISKSITLYVNDPEGDSLTFITSSLDINITTTVENDTLTLIPSSNWHGIADILVKVEDNGLGKLSDSESFTLTVNSLNDKPSASIYTAPEEGNNIIINTNNMDTTNLTFEWSPSMDADKDILTYLFHAEWDTANQVNHPVTTLFQEGVLGTKFLVPYVELWDALDFKNRMWFNQPVMKWKVDVTDGIDTTFSTEVRTINIGYYDVLALAKQLHIPTEYALFQNYPNPFNPITRIEYDLPAAGMVNLTIYNLLGQKVTSLTKGWQEPGRYSLSWDGHNDHNIMVSSGLYFYYLETQEFKQIKKMMLLK